jgi:glycosyltransferase involved in cell wall biosynthesis
MNPRRIAFTLIPSSVWMGGFNYLINLFKCVSLHQKKTIHPVLFCGKSASEKDVAAFSEVEGIEVVFDRVFDSSYRRRGLLEAMFLGLDQKAIACFCSYDIDLLFESATYYGWRCPIPAIAWFPDFQHRYMRGFFSPFAWFRREIGFRAQVLSGRKILLSSEDARHDCESFYPSSCENTTVLPFPAPVDPTLMTEDPYSILTKYALPREFAFLPNQFWKHKNHVTVVKALGLLKRRRMPVTVVATGNLQDRRCPNHFNNLIKLAGQNDVTGHFIILGPIPREHVIALMRICTVFINPSYFEGWSTTVEEAKTFRVPMLLSDLKVHREQAGNSAYFFPPYNYGVLADLLDTYGRTSPTTARVPISGMEFRMSEFAIRFSEAAISAIEGFSLSRNSK